jgi:hypothetical protein
MNSVMYYALLCAMTAIFVRAGKFVPKIKVSARDEHNIQGDQKVSVYMYLYCNRHVHGDF